MLGAARKLRSVAIQYVGESGLEPSLEPYADTMMQLATIPLKGYTDRLTLLDLVSAGARVRNLPSYVVASVGRSGSTVLSECLAEGLVSSHFPDVPDDSGANLVILSFIRHLADAIWMPGIVYKTHDLPCFPDKEDMNVRSVFVFSDPVEIVLSVMRHYGPDGDSDWLAGHAANLGADPADLADLADRDVFGLAGQADAWIRPMNHPHMAIHLDAVWDRQAEVEAFLEVPLKLPAKRARKAALDSASPELTKKLMQTYGELREQLRRMPAFQVWP